MTRDSLFQAVLADPDAEAPRAAFAGWLKQQGDPRGEFIELQLRASRSLRSNGFMARETLDAMAAANKLREQHARQWTDGVEQIATEPRFYRGFVEGVTLDARTFLDRADELYARAPIRHLQLTGAKSALAELARSSHLERIVGLTITSSSLDDDDVRTLAASPHIERLRRLDLARNRIGVAGYEALCASPHLKKLAFVNLIGNLAPEPTEEISHDAISGLPDPMSKRMPELGAELEAKFGPIAWLRAPSLLVNFPPTEADF